MTMDKKGERDDLSLSLLLVTPPPPKKNDKVSPHLEFHQTEHGKELGL